MSLIQQKLCFKILNEYFGKIVAKVGEVLMKKGSNSLHYVITVSQLPRKKVQEAICVLIKHNLVIWDDNKSTAPGYILLNDRVLLLLRFPRYVYLVREQYGEDAEMVVDILCKEGQATASQIIISSTLKLIDAAEQGTGIKAEIDDKHIAVRNAFDRLVNDQFIQRCSDPADATNPVPVLTIKQEQLHRFSGDMVDLKLLQQEIKERRTNRDQSIICQSSKTNLSHPDKDIFWRINYDRFHIELRDGTMCNSVSTRIDPIAGGCFGSILKVSYRRNDPWVPTFQPVQFSDIKDQQRSVPYLEQYMKMLVECGGDSLTKVGDAGGGEYTLSVASMVRCLTMSQIDCIVRERFGSKAARIFRLVRENGMMEQAHIAELSMVSQKECNLLTHRLLNHNFLSLYEVRKGILPSLVSKSFYLFHVDLLMLVRMLLEWTYKSLWNLMVQREKQFVQNKRLLERKTRVEIIVENLKQSGGTQEQISEVEEIFTPSEREVVEKVIATQDKLLDVETGLDETLFLLQMFIYYQTHK